MQTLYKPLALTERLELEDTAEKTKILLVHPGASWSTHDVYAGLRFGMSWYGAQTAIYRLDVRIARSADWLTFNWEQSKLPESERPNPRDIQYHAASGVIERACRLEPDWIVIVSGMYFDVDLIKFLKRCGFKIALVLTESPYDDDAQVFVAPLADQVFVNERISLPRLTEANPNTHYLPHAWHNVIHLPNTFQEDDPQHDVLFIGTGFEERVRMLAGVPWGEDTSGNAELSLYGHWTDLEAHATLKSAIRGDVLENAHAARLYQRAQINLNMHRTSKGATADESMTITAAESLNPRCYELAACGAFFLTDARPELFEIFGDRIPTFDSSETLTEQIRYWRAHPEQRAAIARDALAAVQSHHWVARAEHVLSVLLS